MVNKIIIDTKSQNAIAIKNKFLTHWKEIPYLCVYTSVSRDSKTEGDGELVLRTEVLLRTITTV
jgi:hypothetical protein